MENSHVGQEMHQEMANGSMAGKWQLVAAMVLSGIVAIVSGAYLLTA